VKLDELGWVLESVQLSVSSNGSTWVKLAQASFFSSERNFSFSILERIDVGETSGAASLAVGDTTFSILERIDVGETCFAAQTCKC